MANILKIKRTAYGSSGVPQASEVTYGEWAWSNSDSKMYFTAADTSDGSDRILYIKDLIPDAQSGGSGSARGKASFNNTNFSVSSGYVQIATNGVVSSNVAANAIVEAKIQDNAVTANKIADNTTFAGNCGTTGSFTVGTDLIVQGDTVTLNTSTLTVEDIAIEIAKNATDSNTSDGAGLVVGGWTGCPTILYDHTGTQWEFNKPIEAQNGFNDTTFDGGAFTGA